MESAVVVFFGLWFIASLLRQVAGKKCEPYLKYDIFNLVHGWNYFAPNPLKHDFHIITRKKNVRLNRFRLFNIYYSSFAKVIFHPQTRVNLMLFKLCSGLEVKIQRASDPDELPTSINYVMLANIVVREITDSSEEVQFAVIKLLPSNSHNEVKIILISDFHGK